MANLAVRLMVRMRTIGILIFAASLCVYYFVKMGSCLAWVATVEGFLPMHVVMTALVIVLLYLFQPKDPNDEEQILQVRERCCAHVGWQQVCAIPVPYPAIGEGSNTL